MNRYLENRIEQGSAAASILFHKYLGELAKARDKYGEAAMAPGGHPDFDVLDYAINEVVGLHRYGDMLQARAQVIKATFVDGCKPDDPTWRACMRLDMAGERLKQIAVLEGEDLIAIQQNLFAQGIDMGLPEMRTVVGEAQKQIAST